MLTAREVSVMTQSCIQGEPSVIFGEPREHCPIASGELPLLCRRVESAPMCSLGHLVAEASSMQPAGHFSGRETSPPSSGGDHD